MNTGAIITAAGTVLTAVATVLVGWFVKRTDRAAKMTQANMDDQQYILKLVGALRDDYWGLDDAWYTMRSIARSFAARLMLHGEVTDALPEKPVAKHRDLEGRHARGEPIEPD